MNKEHQAMLLDICERARKQHAEFEAKGIGAEGGQEEWTSRGCQVLDWKITDKYFRGYLCRLLDYWDQKDREFGKSIQELINTYKEE